MCSTEDLSKLANAKLFPSATTRCQFSTSFLTNWALTVYDPEPGKTIKHRQLRLHPRFKKDWDQYYSNEIGHLFQGVSKIPDVSSKRVEGTGNFHIIRSVMSPPTAAKKSPTPRSSEKSNPTRKKKTHANHRRGQ